MQNYANEFRKTHIIPALDRGIFKTDDLVALTQKENISRVTWNTSRAIVEACPQSRLDPIRP